jgi:hypothetical protein
MNPDHKIEVESIEENTVVARAIDERSHPDVELAVNRGIAAAVLDGVPEGLKIMEEAGVPKSISVRVLNSKARRRSSDWK